jgi:ubiquinone/menaquinone biosynthesis C-methylase UbiE
MEEAMFFNSHDQLMEAVLELFPMRRDITILDCGSGTGVFGQKVENYFVFSFLFFSFPL